MERAPYKKDNGNPRCDLARRLPVLHQFRVICSATWVIFFCGAAVFPDSLEVSRRCLQLVYHPLVGLNLQEGVARSIELARRASIFSSEPTRIREAVCGGIISSSSGFADSSLFQVWAQFRAPLKLLSFNLNSISKNGRARVGRIFY